MRDALTKTGIPADSIQLVPGDTHDSVKQLMSARGFVDLLIPRGGASLINSIVNDSLVPVIETGRNIVIEGTSYETTINTTDPTTNRTVTLPDRTGTLAIIETGRNIVVEGTSYDTTLTTTDPTADRTITFQNASGTVITTGNLTVDGTTTGDVLVGEGDSLAYAIVFGS